MTNFSQPMLRATASRSLFSVESADAPNWAPKLSAENELAAALDTGGGGRRQRASVSAALQMRNMAFGQPAPVVAAWQATWQPLSSSAEPQPRSPRLAALAAHAVGSSTPDGVQNGGLEILQSQRVPRSEQLSTRLEGLERFSRE